MYFRELDKRYASRWRTTLLRSIFSIALGLLLLVLPDEVTDDLLWLVGVVLIIDALIIAVPLLLGRVTHHLWKIVVAREVVQILLGVLLITDISAGFDLFVIIISLLLLFRAVIELLVFVDVHASAGHRALILLASVLFFALAIVGFLAVFVDALLDIDFVALYLIVMGLSHLFHAIRGRGQYAAVEDYERAIMGDDHIPDMGAVAAKPLPPPDRTFLLPHLDVGKYKSVLVFSPHPDDLEAFVGGLVYRLSGKVVSVIFSGGDKGRWQPVLESMDDGTYIRARLEESDQAALLLGVDEINYLGYLDREVPISGEAINKVLHMLRVHQPDLVVAFEYHKRATPYPHPDHLAVANVVRQALARYDKADSLDYIVTPTLIPNCFVDVTGVRRLKLDALACHTTQTDLNKLIFPFLEKLFSRLWGTFSGVDYAEGYRSVDIPEMRKRLPPLPSAVTVGEASQSAAD